MKFDRAVEYNIKRTLKELYKYEVSGMELILEKIADLRESRIYEKMYECSIHAEKVFSPDAQQIVNEENQSNQLLSIGIQNLGKSPFHILSGSNLISINNLNAMYSVLIMLYYAQVERELGYEDLRHIYFSGMDQLIINSLDKFPEKYRVPEVGEEYLILLKNLRWDNKHAKNLFKKLNYIKSLIGQNKFGIRYPLGIQRAEDKFVLFIAGCSAVNSNRDTINEQDIITGYETYFNLINTDITKFNMEYNPSLENNGYLVCNNCGEYYVLEEGESPEHFSQTCECGGVLTYSDEN